MAKTVIAGALGECVHVAGVSNFLRLAEAAGWHTIFLGPAASIYNPAAIGAYDIAEKLGVPAFAAFLAPLYSPTKEFPSPFFPFRNLGPFNKLSHKFFAKMAPAIYRRPVNEWRRDVLGLSRSHREERLQGKPVTKLYAYSGAVVPRPADWDDSSVVTEYWFLDASASCRVGRNHSHGRWREPYRCTN